MSLSEGIVEAILLSAVIVAFGFILKLILDIAKEKQKNPRPLVKRDQFLKDHGYSWDYVFVFKVWDEYEREELSAAQTKYSMKFIIDRLHKGNLETRCFYSAQRDEVYVKIRADPQRLKAEAHRIKYPLQLDKERLRIKLQSGKKGPDNKYIWEPINITDEFKVSKYEFNDFIFGRYDSNPDLQSLYKINSRSGQIFRGVDRIKLIVSCIEAKTNETPPGCGLNLNKLGREKCLLACFAMHDYEELAQLERRWLMLLQFKQPIGDIKDYFGEKIGMYFLYLDHYFKWLLVPAVSGTIVYIVTQVFWDSNTGEGPLVIIFAIFMVCWSTLYIEYWKRIQIKHAMIWGVSGFESVEQDRPQFIGEIAKSPIDGKDEQYFSHKKRRKLIMYSNMAIIYCVLVVIGFVLATMIFSFFLVKFQSLTFSGFDFGGVIASLVNALVIQVLNFVYGMIAEYLTDKENHRTDTYYEDSLIAKIFVFQMINSYAVIVFTAFFKNNISGIGSITIPRCAYSTGCTKEVGTALGGVFISRIVLALFMDIAIPLINRHKKRQQESSGLEPGAKISPIEEQYTLAEFDILKGTLKDFAELVIQFGYITLFVAAFPLVPLMAFIAAYIIIRINGWKFCQIYRRPSPKSAEDIGTWQQFIEVVSVLSIMTNLGLIIFTGGYFFNYTYIFKWFIFVICEHAALTFKYTISLAIEDVPFAVEMQLARQEFLVSKVLINTPDEREDDYKTESSNINLIINDTDHDWESDEKRFGEHLDTGARAGAATASSSTAHSPAESNSKVEMKDRNQDDDDDDD